MTREQVLNFIEKLSRKTTANGATVEEAAAAAAKIQELCQKYQVSVAEAIADETDYSDIAGLTLMTYGSSFRETLVAIIAKYTFCKSIRLNGTGRCVVVGSDVNLKIVGYLYHSLSKQLVKLHNADFEKHVAKNANKRQKSLFRKGWFHGALIVILERFEAQAKQFESETTAVQKTALVVVNTKLEEAYQKMFPKAKEGKPRKIRLDSNAKNLGKQAGNKVQINKGLEMGYRQIGG